MAAIIGAPMRATVCLPTYNERENLPRMIEALGAVLREGDRVLVIDDGSPDGTGEIADGLAAEHAFVDVLHRTSKEGLGRAYIAGFHQVLAGDAELVLEMDCDFSHDQQDVPRLIAAAEGGADLVLGSRYVPGGRTRNWGLVRRLISRGGSLYTALFLHMGVKDPTGGFKCFRRAVLESLDLDGITPRGYAFQIETTYRVKQAGFSVVEIPITFADREVGQSKMSRAVVLEAIWRVPLLRVGR
jgi:dolichol-phosphate mannosyltransferase